MHLPANGSIFAECKSGIFTLGPTRDLSILPTGAKRADLYKNIDRAGDKALARGKRDWKEKNWRGGRHRYYLESNDLFVNMQYKQAIAV